MGLPLISQVGKGTPPDGIGTIDWYEVDWYEVDWSTTDQFTTLPITILTKLLVAEASSGRSLRLSGWELQLCSCTSVGQFSTGQGICQKGGVGSGE